MLSDTITTTTMPEAWFHKCVLDLADHGGSRLIADVFSAYLKQRPAYTDRDMSLLAMVSLNIRMPDLAEKFLMLALQLNPDDPSIYTNLSSALREQKKLEQAADVASEGLARFPKNARLWNAKGTAIIDLPGQLDEAVACFERGLELKPGDPQLLKNLADRKLNEARSETLYRQALKRLPDDPDINLSLALKLLDDGNLKEGWKYYAKRSAGAAEKSHSISYDVPMRIVDRLPDSGVNTVMVLPEQGLGDEILFAGLFPKLIEEFDEVWIGCEPRLRSIFERSFTSATVFAFEDKIKNGRRVRCFPGFDAALQKRGMPIDCAIKAGSLMARYWPETGAEVDIGAGYLVPDPKLVAEMAARMDLQKDKLNIGISWTSKNYDPLRVGAYPEPHMIKEMTDGEYFSKYILQYGPEYGDFPGYRACTIGPVMAFQDISLLQNIEANLAIVANLDVLIGPASAPQMYGLAMGKPVGIITPVRPWWAFGHAEHPPFSSNVRWFCAGGKPIIQQKELVRDYLCKLHAEKERDAP